MENDPAMTKEKIGRLWLRGPSAHSGVPGLALRLLGVALAAVMLAALVGCSEGVDLTPGYIDGLSNADSNDWEKAISALGRLGADGIEAAAPIVAESSDVRAVSGAIRVLAMNSSVESLTMVQARLGDADPEIRQAAIKGVAALAKVSKRRAAESLGAALADEDPQCVRAAATGLAELDLAEATAALERSFESGTGVEVVLAAEALYRVDGRPEALNLIVESLRPGVAEDIQAVASLVVVDTEQVGGELLRLEFVGPMVELLLREGDAPAAAEALEQIRDELIEELCKPQIPKHSRLFIGALGRAADRPSADALTTILRDQVLKMGGEKKKDHDLASRKAAADALGRAAVSARVARDPGLRETIGEGLKDILTWDKYKADIRVQIASAISLCRLRDRKGVDFLLLQLARTDREQAGVGGAPKDVDVARQRELTALRVRAQEALTASGDFVVSDLREALDNPDAGDITRWAAITTLGELGVAEARPRLIEVLTATVPASQAGPARGDLPAEIVLEGPDGPLRIDADRATVQTVALGGTDAPVPAHGKYVRQAAAQALGRIGGDAAAEALQEARTSHEALRGQLQRCLDQRAYAQLVPKEALDGDKKREARGVLRDLCEKLLEEQEDVLFYIGKAQATLRDEQRELASHRPCPERAAPSGPLDRIIAAREERVAPEEPPQPLCQPHDRALLAQRFDHVLAATGLEPARSRQQGGNADLIGPDQGHRRPAEHLARCARARACALPHAVRQLHA